GRRCPRGGSSFRRGVSHETCGPCKSQKHCTTEHTESASEKQLRVLRGVTLFVVIAGGGGGRRRRCPCRRSGACGAPTSRCSRRRRAGPSRGGEERRCAAR